jgi:hypothetical protein
VDAKFPWVLLTCTAALALVLLGAKLGRWLSERALVRNARAYNERGQRGEQKAERLLKKLGYRVRGRQVAGSYELLVDGTLERVQLSADLIVERNGRELVAEVKTGRNAPRVTYAETRRQMLEYQLAFKVPGVLLVDVEENHVREVQFPLTATTAHRSSGSGFALWLMALLLLAGAAWYLRKA